MTEIEIAGSRLHLRDVAIYPVGPDRASIGASGLLAVAREKLFPVVDEAGFQRLCITGTGIQAWA